MRRIMVALLLVMSLSIPVFAQDTEVPPTVEVFETPTPDIVTATPAPTDVPTPEPTAVPVPDPDPIDESKIPQSVYAVILVLVIGIVSIAFAGILTAAKGLPEWAKDLLLSGADSGLSSLDDYAKGTETPIDDLAVTELRRLVEQLRAELRATQQQVLQNTNDIQVTAQKVQGN